MLAKGQAAASGFDSAAEYITNLIRLSFVATQLSREESLADLRRLRSETPKMTPEEIVSLVKQSRTGLP